jgi:hypothetical protein
MGQAVNVPGASPAESAASAGASLASAEQTKLDSKLRETRLNGAPGGAMPATASPFSKANLVRFAVVVAEFGLLVWIIRMFQLESVRFGNLMVLAWIGFVVHHFLPAKLRLPFFSVLSIAGLYLFAGGWITICVLSGGLVLIALCHLPIPFVARVGLVLVAGCVLAALRVQWLKTPITTAAWMFLGSLFMFRIIIYLYDLKHRTAPFSPFRATAFFFMLPNHAFPLFPVIDYKTFCTTYFNDEPLHIYQTGVRWMLRGLTHLLLYRIVYQLLQVDPMEVSNLGGVAQCLVATYLLYLHVSGTFHLSVGLLHLFGFNLPETNHLYYLSASFTDLWRRINIYWKDFVTKIFFYPAFFRLKRLGQTTALVVATLIAFFGTWLFHGYQSLWIRGELGFGWREASFWCLLGVLVLATVLYEAKMGRGRALSKQRRTLRTQAWLALQTIATFVTMCILWTYWTAQSTDELTWLLKAAGNVTPGSVAAIVCGLAGLGVAAVLFGASTSERTEGSARTGASGGLFSWRSVVATVGLSCGILLLGALPRVMPLYGTFAGELLTTLQEDRKNEIDMAEARHGYYEDLDVIHRDENFNFLNTDAHWWPHHDYHKATNNFLLVAPLPNFAATPRDRQGRERQLHTNQWGMRDRDYTKEKPPGTYRIALLGTSHEMGHNIGDADTFENLVEDRLNKEDTNGGTRKYEILNFSVGSYGAIQKLWLLESKVLEFDIDAVFFVSYIPEPQWTVRHLAKVLKEGYAIPEPYRDFIHSLYEKAEVDASMPEARIEKRLKPYAYEAIGFAFNRLAEVCRQRGIQVCMLYRPQPMESAHLQPEGRRRIMELAQQAGLTILDLSPAYDPVRDRHTLMVTPSASDSHTNEYGHQLLADQLYMLLHTDVGAALLKRAAPANGR